MLTLPDAWTWDFWLADTGTEFHIFYLRASRALHDPHRRHGRAGVGHAVSVDLRTWTVLPDALVHADPPAFDDQATWTGSVLQAPDGTWRMFYTGLSGADPVAVQRIGVATSSDLTTWQTSPEPILVADPRWYETHEESNWRPQEHWRDPWVFADPTGEGWHMLITGRANHGDPDDRAVVAHARSEDLEKWQALPPLSTPGSGFGQLEVMQVEVVEGRAVLLFSCLGPELSGWRRAQGQPGGIWSVPADSLTGPFDPSKASPLTGPELYSGRLIRDRSGQWVLLAFHNEDPTGAFIGGTSDPMPVTWATGPDGAARLTIVAS